MPTPSKNSPCVGIRTCTDYSPFGVELEGRTVSGGYRFGFQNQELDYEMKGVGNSVNYTFRMHDPRLGRFFTSDPLYKNFPWNSTYAFSENIPINAVELEGKQRYYTFNSAYLSSKALVAIKTMKYDDLVKYMDGLVTTKFSTTKNLEYAQMMLGEKFDEASGFNKYGTEPATAGNYAVKGSFRSPNSTADYFYVRLVIDNGDGTWSTREIKVINNENRLKNLNNRISDCQTKIETYKKSIASQKETIQIIIDTDLKPSNDDFKVKDFNSGSVGVDFESISFKLGQLAHIQLIEKSIEEMNVKLDKVTWRLKTLEHQKSQMSSKNILIIDL